MSIADWPLFAGLLFGAFVFGTALAVASEDQIERVTMRRVALSILSVAVIFFTVGALIVYGNPILAAGLIVLIVLPLSLMGSLS